MADDVGQGTCQGLDTPGSWPPEPPKASTTAVGPSVEILIPAVADPGAGRALGRQIEADYHGKPLTIVAVLTGSLILLADLIRQIRLPHRVALMQASSYRGAAPPPRPGDQRVVRPGRRGPGRAAPGRHPRHRPTLATLVRHLADRGARSVRTAVLLRKIGRQEVPLEPDYCGFTIPDAFVVGYGLDFNDDYRHLPYVGVLKEGARSPTGRPITPPVNAPRGWPS